MIRSLNNIIYRNILGNRANRLRFKYPPRLLMRQSTTFHMIGIIGKVNLQTMIKSARYPTILLRLKRGKNRRRPPFSARFALRARRRNRNHPRSTAQKSASYITFLAM